MFRSLLKLQRSQIVTVLVLGSAMFMLSGGIDFVSAIIYQEQYSFDQARLTALSPVAFMLLFFLVVGVMLIVNGAKQTDKKLGAKQLDAGFIMVFFLFVFFEVLLRVGLN